MLSRAATYLNKSGQLVPSNAFRWAIGTTSTYMMYTRLQGLEPDRKISNGISATSWGFISWCSPYVAISFTIFDTLRLLDSIKEKQNDASIDGIISKSEEYFNKHPDKKEYTVVYNGINVTVTRK